MFISKYFETEEKECCQKIEQKVAKFWQRQKSMQTFAKKQLKEENIKKPFSQFMLTITHFLIYFDLQ